MLIYSLGNSWISTEEFVNGLNALDSIWHWFFAWRFAIGAILTVAFMATTWQVLRHKNYWAVAAWVLLPIYITAMKTEVPATLGDPPGAASISASLSQAQARVTAAQDAVNQAQKTHVNLASAQAALGQAESDLANMQKLQTKDGAVVAKVPSAFAFAYTVESVLFFNVWHAIDSVSFTSVSPETRQAQTYMAQQLAASPQLTPVEHEVAQQLGSCLSQKERFIDETAEIDKNIKAGIDPDPTRAKPRTGKALATAWAGYLAPSQQAEKQACVGMSDKLKQALDASITPADKKAFLSGFTVDGHSFFKTTTKAQEQYLAAQMGVPVSDVAGKSPQEIATLFLRYKQLAAISQQLQDNLSQVGSSAAGSAGNLPSSLSTKGATNLSNWFGSFGLTVAGVVQSAQDFAMFLLPISFFFCVFYSLLPGQFKRAWSTFLMGMTFVFAWQVCTLLVVKYSASTTQTKISMEQPKSGLGYVGQLVDESFTHDSGPAETDAALAAGGAARVATTQMGKRAIAAAADVLEATGDLAPPVGAAIMVATSALSVKHLADEVDKRTQKFASVVLKGGAVNPALVSLENGALQQQQAQIEAVQNRAQLVESMLIVGSPFIAMAMVWGMFAAFGQAGSGQAVASMGHGIAQQISGALTRFIK